MNLFKRDGVLASGVIVLLMFPAVEGDTRAPWFGGEPKAEMVNIQLPTTIKVALLHSHRPVAIGCTGPYSYIDSKKSKSVSVDKKSLLKIKVGKHGMMIGQKPAPNPLIVSPADENDHLTLNDRPYRGKLILRFHGKVIDVIEQVGLEEYLYGVLPREVGSDWPVESLKAQAVISRTYVVANVGKSNGKGYDVSNNVFSQVYGGLRDENPSSNQAVQDTRGEVLVNETGAAVLTFFHSSCGGQTESPEYVWREVKTAPSYLVSVRDPFCKEDPFYTWEFNIQADTLQKRLRHAGYRVGAIKTISVAKTSPSGRAWLINVESSSGRIQVQGNSFRLALGADALRSTLFTTVERRGKIFHFEGHGWGHGVGLCQWGARGRALAGQSYAKILDAYYPKVRLVKAGVPEAQAGTGVEETPHDNAH